MPGVRLVERPTALRPYRRSPLYAAERAQAKDLLVRAAATGQVIELTLDPDERAYSIRLHSRALARELGYTVRFQTARSRSYRDWQDREKDEAAVLLVHVTPGSG